MKKRILSVLMACAMCASLLAGCGGSGGSGGSTGGGSTGGSTGGGTSAPSGGSGSAEPVKIAFISNAPVDSEEWIQNLVAGLDGWADAHEGYEIQVIEAIGVDEYLPKTEACCEAGFQIIITSYSDMAEATIKCAEQYPDVKFGTLDGEIPDLEKYSNIEDFRLNRNQTAFVQGAVAAMMTKTGKVGFVGGGEYASIDELLAGWQYGLQYIGKEKGTSYTDLVAYTNTFTDPTAGKEYALNLINEGCDIIYAAAGGSGTGVAQACQEGGVMFAACDVHYPEVAPDVELGSTLYFFDVMILSFIEDAISGNYKPGTTTEYGIAQGAGRYEFATTNSLVPDDVKTMVADIEAKIASGEIELSLTPLHK